MRARRRPPLLVQLSLLLGLALAVLSPRAAHAMSDKKAVDVTIDIVVTAGNQLGFPLDPEQVKIIKDVIGCAVGSSGGDCVKNVVVAHALQQMGVDNPQAAGAVNCLLDGKNAGGCLKDAGVGFLPKEAQPLATCVVNGGNVAECTAKAAVAQILPKVAGVGVPPQVENAVNCVIGGKSLEQCAKDMAKSCTGSGSALQSCIANTVASQVQNPQAAEMVRCLGKSGGDAQACATKVGEQVLGPREREQLDQVNKTFSELAKINASNPTEGGKSNPRDYPGQPLALYNMMKIAQGVKDNDIGTIILYGGSALYQIAAGIIINYFFPGLGSILGPVAAGMIANHTIAIQEGFDAIVKGDPVGLAEAAATWYATTYIVPVCGLIPNGKFKEVTCGTVAKAIGTIVGAAGDVAKAILGVGEDFLKLIGVWDFVDGVASGIWNGIKDAVGAITGAIGDGIDAIFGGDDDKKPSLPPAIPPAEYFATNMASACLGKATARVIASRVTGKPGDPDTGKVLEACTQYYTPYTVLGPGIAQLQCKKLVDGLNAMSQAAADNLVQAAKALISEGHAPAIFLAQVYAQNRTGDDGGDHGAGDLCSPDFWTKMNAGYARFCANQIHTPMKDGTKPYPDSFRAGNVSEQAKMCPMPTYSGATEGACLSALNDFKKEQAEREAKDPKQDKMVGPDSAFCKLQKKADEFNAAFRPNCDFKGVKKFDAGGKVIDLPRGIECDSLDTHFPRPGRKNPTPPIDTTVQKIPNNMKIDEGVTVINYRPGKEFLPVPFPLDPPQLQIPRWPVVPFPPVLQPPKVAGPSKGGGKGGTNMVYQNDGPGLKPPKLDRKPPRLSPPVANNGQGSGGPSYVYGNSGNAPISAMDRLGNINAGGGINSVAGNSGGAAIGRPPPMMPPVAAAPSKGGGSGGAYMVNGASGNSPTKGGSGGAYMVNGASGNSPTKGGSGGAYMVNGASGNSPVNKPPATSAPRPSSSSTPPGFGNIIEYGGCSSCNKPPPPMVVR